MVQLVRQYKSHPQIRQTALDLVGAIPGKNWRAEVEAIFAYVRDQIRYTRDINGVETLQTPLVTLQVEQGDCDDKSTLLAALLEAVGHPTRFVAIGRMPDQYSHVFVQTLLGNKWVSLDPTMPVGVGWTPKGTAPAMVANN
jgi:transglutaminase-like putative cysteine protease